VVRRDKSIRALKNELLTGDVGQLPKGVALSGQEASLAAQTSGT
jgi:hypothetical protein